MSHLSISDKLDLWGAWLRNGDGVREVGWPQSTVIGRMVAGDHLMIRGTGLKVEASNDLAEEIDRCVALVGTFDWQLKAVLVLTHQYQWPEYRIAKTLNRSRNWVQSRRTRATEMVQDALLTSRRSRA